MKYKILSSGSNGNCIIVNDYFMLDCGLPYSKIKQYLDKIKVIFISHKHQDHLKKTTIKKLVYEKPNIKYIVGKQLVYDLMELGVEMNNIIVLELEKWYHLGSVNIKLDYLYHDVPNYCVHIEFLKPKIKILYATDTSKIDHIEAKDYDYYYIEANYDTDEEIRNQIKEAKEKGEFTYLERVVETHLSMLDAINWLDKNNTNNGEVIFIHQHKDKEVKDEI